jgi:anaerobic magnesium-protoporphyrin IX monomethyl ester cyclase
MRILLINVPHPSIKMVPQCRPGAIRRALFQRDARLRHAMRWYTETGPRVWPYEILNFMRDHLLKHGLTLAAF